MKDFFGFQDYFTLNCRGKIIDLSIPKVMGILNLTPDSFSDGGQFFDEKKAIIQAEKMIKQGAHIIDIGAQSTRPNTQKISAKEEMQRLGKVISTLKKNFPETLISLDTFYSEVVKFGEDEGIDIVNDISGGQFDKMMFQTVAKLKLPYILMHIADKYEKMHEKDPEKDILIEENYYFSKKIEELLELGVKDIILDPGIGFGKTIEQNYQLLEELEFINFGMKPILIGISRKSFIYIPLKKSPTEIIQETQELHLKALKKGAKILRTHDVTETSATIRKYLSEAL